MLETMPENTDVAVENVPATRAAVSPLTGTADVALLRTIPTERLLQVWQRSLGIDVAPFLEGVDRIELFRCEQTGLEFFWPPELAGPAGLYERLQSFPWYYMERKWEYSAALDALAGVGTVLEIGCGEGAFLDQCRARGLRAEGCELNAAAAAAARRRGHDVLVATAGEIADGGKRWDAVCSFQVLEHVADAGGFLRDLARLVKPGGLVVLAVPNRESFVRHANERLEIALDLPPHHMSRWNAAAFRGLGRWFPLEFVRAECEPLAPEHLRHWVGAQSGRIRRALGLAGRILANGLTRRIAVAGLACGLRHFFRGQSLLVILQKRG